MVYFDKSLHIYTSYPGLDTDMQIVIWLCQASVCRVVVTKWKRSYFLTDMVYFWLNFADLYIVKCLETGIKIIKVHRLCPAGPGQVVKMLIIQKKNISYVLVQSCYCKHVTIATGMLKETNLCGTIQPPFCASTTHNSGTDLKDTDCSSIYSPNLSTKYV